MKSAPAVGFQYRVSPTLVVATVVTALLAIIAVWLVRGSAWLHAVSTVLIVAYAATVIRSLIRPPMKSLLWRGDGGVQLHLRGRVSEDDRELQGAVQSARVMGPLIVLRLRWPPRERAAIWLLPDNLDPDTRRRLRMRLGADGGHPVSGNADNG